MFDNPIYFFVLIAIISAISEWLASRRKARQSNEETAGEELDEGKVEQRARRRRTLREQQENWETNWRRFLEGESPVEKTPPNPINPIDVKPPIEIPTSQTHSIDVEKQRDFMPSVSHKSKDVKRGIQTTKGQVVKGVAISDQASSSVISDVRKVKRSPSWIPNFQSKSTIRKAIVASVVLGSPKGFDEDSDLLRL